MKERPILFSGAMVSALLAGTKTQTRRVVKGADNILMGWPYRTGEKCIRPESSSYLLTTDGHHQTAMFCPYGQPGDRLWVRETWAPVDFMECGYALEEPVAVGYRADLSAISHEKDDVHPLDVHGWNWGVVKWKPSIFMPRWASRLTLEVAEVRVQRLQECSADDAVAEGINPSDVPGLGSDAALVGAYRALWDSINGDRADWNSNPWVWAISFRVVSRWSLDTTPESGAVSAS